MSEINNKLDEILRYLVEFKTSTNTRLEHMDIRFEQIETRFEHMDKRFDQVDKRFEQVNKTFEQVDKRFDRIDTTLARIEKDQTEDVVALLKQMNHKMDVRDSEIQALNKRVFKVESEIERLSQQ
ncbi:hypothetical protein [Alkalihalobacterium elongatum]|uniref:hypothetical protein n=1 Tax=Alkalihalobacterium elongatum TaxID=2675466 RepID=UPI001C1FDCAC|nr:hypothetical protein [Alkalihalobacterium elongatum]